MKIRKTIESGCLVLRGEPSEEDIRFTETRSAKQDRREARFWIPSEISAGDLHPDLFGLLSILIYGPFSRRQIEFDWSVTSAFHETVKRSFRRHVGPVDPLLSPRQCPSDGVEALAFSGGVDSVATLMLLPRSTISIFLNRRSPSEYPGGLYSAEAALRSCRDVLNTARKVVVVDTDLEHVRDPVGFPVDWANAAGAVLLADALSLTSISFGMIQESAFSLGRDRYSDLASRSIYSAWAPIFDVVALPISLPSSGLSEVVTSLVSSFFSRDVRAQSCVRGTESIPCGYCFKCFRKSILDAKLSGDVLPAKHFDIAFTSKEVKRRLLEVPIHHENVLAWSLSGLKCDPHPVLEALQEKTHPILQHGRGLRYLEKFYPRGLNYVPAHLREHVHAKIGMFVPDADEGDICDIQNWEISALTEASEYQQGQEVLLQLLSS